MDTFRKRLKWLRKVRGFSQKELAEAAGISRDLITGYETERYRPSYEALCKMASALACSLDFLMTGQESPFPPIDETLGQRPEELKRRAEEAEPAAARPSAEVLRLLRPEPERDETKDQSSPKPRRRRGV